MTHKRLTDQQCARKVTIAASIGNFVEFFDFAIYGYAASAIATVFFPAEIDRSVSIITTFALFGVAFFVRPLGGVVWGRVGDRFGRRTSLSAVILVMAVATIGIGATPGYGTIGIAAPILLLLWRLLQGFALGGEKSGASTYVCEHAPDGERGRYLGQLASASTLLPFSAGAVVMAGLSTLLSDAAFNEWGWRLPFFLGGAIGTVGLYLRTRLPETDAFEQMKEQEQSAAQQSATREALRENKWRMVQLAGAIMGNAGVFYFAMTYVPNYLIENRGMGQSAVFWASAIAPIGYTILVPFIGRYSDRHGRRRVLLIGSIGTAVLMVPSFFLASTGTVVMALLGQIALLVVWAFADMGVAPGQVELFPTRIRVTASSVSFNVSTALFGGTAALMSAWLLDATGMTLAPAVYFSVLALASIPFILRMPETAGTPLMDSPQQEEQAHALPSHDTPAPSAGN